MIPKIIHYCWLSNDPIPQEIKKYMESWHTYLPDYEFMLWDFNRFKIDTSIWVKEAFERKKYAFAADYLRLYAVYNYGGFYLDMDVEVLKPFDELLHLQTAICWQKDCNGLEIAAFGSEKFAPWVKKCMDYYENRHFILSDNKIDNKPQPVVIEEILKKNNYSLQSVNQIDNVIFSGKTFSILSNEFFSPKSYKTKKLEISNNTFTIHHFAASWVNKYDNLSLFAKIWAFFNLPNTNIRNRIKSCLFRENE